MNAACHNVEMLGAYALGALEPNEAAAVNAHAAACPVCQHELEELRAMKDSLGELPPEALLDGPPEGAELALQRTLRQVRTERATMRSRRLSMVVGAAAMVGAVLLGGGIALGSGFTSDETTEPTGLPELAAGSVVAAEENPMTGAQATIMLTPEDGATQVEAVVAGIPEGEECRLVVIGADGNSEVATSWTVSAEAAASVSEPGGSSAIAPDEVIAVAVRNADDEEFVTIPF